jgi:hypothetical protein
VRVASRPLVAGCFAAATAATLVVAAGAPLRATTSVPQPPAVVLARYAAALASLPHPKTVSFEYSVEQLGLRNIEQTHRVYRSGARERDETLVVDGHVLTAPAVRFFANRTYRYDVRAVAPTPDAYAFRFSGVTHAGQGDAYVFATTPVVPRGFAVSEVEIDARRFLPTVLRFRIAGAGARGSGELDYGPSDAYWVICRATVGARLPDGSTAHERLVWSTYRFPESLPPSTFEGPRVTATPAAPLP